VSGIPVAPHPEIVAATLVVQIVAKAAELPVLKANAGETRAAGHGGCHHFHNDSDAPFFVAKMRHFIAHTQIESLSFRRIPHGMHLMEQTITRLFIQINGRVIHKLQNSRNAVFHVGVVNPIVSVLCRPIKEIRH
jgi:hypothetical protein